MDLPVRGDLLPDHSVPVDTTRPLDLRCYEEAAYDTTGFTLYGSLIWRQDPWLQDRVVYARDLRSLNRRLLASYADRTWYLYAPSAPRRGAPTQLTPLEMIR